MPDVEGSRSNIFLGTGLDCIPYLSASYRWSSECVSISSGFLLSNGKIGKRKQPDRVVVDNEEDFTKWWLDSPSTANELVKTIHKPVLKEIKAYIQDSGECPDGCEYIEGKPQFYVRPEEL